MKGLLFHMIALLSLTLPAQAVVVRSTFMLKEMLQHTAALDVEILNDDCTVASKGICSATIRLRLKKATLVAPAMACAPYCCRTAANRPAISSSAASQLTGAKLPLPRGPTRRSGVVNLLSP